MKKVYLFFLIAVFSSQLSARHIIGGEITYRCTGSGGYIFTMFVYRDCNSGGAPFDSPAKVSIYQESNGGFMELRTLDVALGPVEIVPLPVDPCANIPNVCVEKATYTFASNLPALSNNDQYHVLYQRCCRNNTIANLNDPGSQGATYIVTIPTPVTVMNDESFVVIIAQFLTISLQLSSVQAHLLILTMGPLTLMEINWSIGFVVHFKEVG